MKKTIGILCTLAALLALASLPLTVRAANDGEIVEAYCQGNNLYTYISLPSETDAADLTVQARIGSESYDSREPLRQIGESAAPVSYVFMIDISTSMPAFKANVERFVESIVAGAQGKASFLVATFGETFEPIGDFSRDGEAIAESVKGIQYNANQTSLYRGIIDAIEYYNQKEREDGELYNLIIISDGIEVDKNGPTESEVKEQISKSAPLLIHTLGLYTTKADPAAVKASEEALKVLGAFARAASGKHTTYGGNKLTEAQLAGEITDYINNLYLAKFNLFMHTPVGDAFDLGLLFSSTGDTAAMFRLDKSNVPYLEAAVQSDASAENGEGNEEDTQDPEDGNTDDTQDQERDDTQASAGGNTVNQDENNHGKTAPKLLGINLYLLSSILLALLLLAAALIYLLKRKKTVPVDKVDNSIYMKLEVINGRCSTQKRDFYLANEFMIGRSKKCHIPFKDKEVSKKNSRIFLRDNMIYIEDCNSTNGTAISGMRIHAPNRLRSGDEISIGTVKFRLKF